MYVVCRQGLEEVSRTEIGKKIKEGVEEAAKQAKTSAESVSKSGEKLGKTSAFRAISQVCSQVFLSKLSNMMYMYTLKYSPHLCSLCKPVLKGFIVKHEANIK